MLRWVESLKPFASLKRHAHLRKQAKRSTSLKRWRGPWETEEEDSALGLKRGSGSLRPETAAETTKVHYHWSRTRVQKCEDRSQEEDEGINRRVGWEAVQEQEKGMMSWNSKQAYNTLKAPTKTQQHKSAVIENSNGNILTENTSILNRQTEYCIGLYDFELHWPRQQSIPE